MLVVVEDPVRFLKDEPIAQPEGGIL